MDRTTELVSKFERAVLDYANDSGYRQLAKDAREALLSHARALEKDAQRYRWIRTRQTEIIINSPVSPEKSAELDEAIDRAAGVGEKGD